ncbi:MAG: DUF1573 domain-containing protein [Lentisphaerae bacterium]|nr:DUF1573 domain-containing protein [Lentisphaerota bacterium]
MIDIFSLHSVFGVRCWMFGVCFGLATAPVRADGLPLLICNAPDYHFGALSNTNEVPHTFVLANEGDAPLAILRVHPDCGCTLVRLEREVIPPGDEITLPVRLILKGRSGPQHKRITIESNDPDQPRLILSLIGEAVAEVQLKPDRLYWGNLRRDAAEVRTVAVEFHQSATAQIMGAGSSLPSFAVDWETNKPGLAYTLRVRSVPPLALGQFASEAWLETDSSRYPRLTVPLHGRVVGDIYTVPEEISLTAQPARRSNVLDGEGGPVDKPALSLSKGPLQRLLMVQTSLPRPFTILKVEPPLTNMEVRVSSTRHRGYRIELRNIFPDPALDGKLLMITTDCETMPVLTVPFRLTEPR